MNKNIKEKILKKPFLNSVNIIILTGVSLILLLTFCLFVYNSWRYQNKILPGITIAGVPVGGLEETQALEKIQIAGDKILLAGLNFQHQDQKIILQNSLQSLDDPDINNELIELDLKSAVQRARLAGHQYNAVKNISVLVRSLFGQYDLPLTANIKMEEIKTIIKRDMNHLLEAPSNPLVSWQGENFTIQPEKEGKTIDWQEVEFDLRNKIASLSPLTITLPLRENSPTVSIEEAQSKQGLLKKIAQTKPILKIIGDEKNLIEITWNNWKNNLTFEKKDNQIFLTLNEAYLLDLIDSQLKEKITKPAQDARFKVEDGRVIEFKGSQDGISINSEETLKIIQNNLNQNIYESQVVLTPEKAKVSTAEVNNLGITEIIGVGKSDFSGSPPNRRHNIQVGADSLNGILIKPNEEFSLITALGEIDAANDYLPELVIKGNKTIPEYGGGLCQIGTTTFRATLASGLPILERRNHSYRVRYYEPAGTDATIYDPKPDYRFLNDTENNILISTRIEGDELIFEFWGTKDGREIVQTDPKIYNITAPPPTRYIETTDLAPGQKKCTESAHSGADAEFTYKITYPDGEIKNEIFKSHYKPWGAVCLIGVEEITTSTTSSTAEVKQSSGTPSSID